MVRLVALVALSTLLAPRGLEGRQADSTAQADSLGVQDPPLGGPQPAAVDSTAVPPAFFPTVPAEVPPGPLSPGERYTFTRDSVLWSSALTLADMLTIIPGVYVARGGFLGQPEIIHFAGRGAQSLEIFWDGVPYLAMGGDSVFVDPGQISLSYLRRVDVEVWPSMLRVYLVSERHEGLEPRSMVRVMSGAFGTAQYAGHFQKRWPSGVGLSLAGDFLQSDGAPASSRSDKTLDIWGKFEWLPTARTGVSFQVRRHDQDREAFTGGDFSTPAAPPRAGIRTDQVLRLFSRHRDDGLGWGWDVAVAQSSWEDDSVGAEEEPLVRQEVRQAFVRAQYRLPWLTAEALGRVGDTRVTQGVEGRLGVTPVPGVTLAGAAGWRAHSGGRRTRYATGSSSLAWGPFFARGTAAWRDGVQAVALTDETAQVTTDYAAAFGMRSSRLTGSVGVARRDAFLPLVSVDLPAIAALDSSRAADYLLAEATLHPIRALTVRGWYAHPRTVGPNLQPPQHGRADIIFRSRFWRTFRSGVFQFMLRYGFEFWGEGVAGLDETGNPIPLPQTNFQEIFIQFQLVDFHIFWNLRNATNTRAAYVPGRTYPVNAQTFGVRWSFAN